MKRPAGIHVLIAAADLVASTDARVVGYLVEVPQHIPFMDSGNVAFDALTSEQTAVMRRHLLASNAAGQKGTLTISVNPLEDDYEDEENGDV